MNFVEVCDQLWEEMDELTSDSMSIAAGDRETERQRG